MDWARAAIVSGLTLVALGFWIGVEYSPSATVDGRTFGCHHAIPASWLMSGSNGAAASVAGPRTAHERQVQAACDDVEDRAEVLTWGLLGAGFLAGLGGWTGVRERQTARPGAQLR